MSNNTKIKYLNVENKIYQIIDISFFHMTIEAVETDLTVTDVPGDELWSIEEFRRYKVKLINNGVGRRIEGDANRKLFFQTLSH